MYISHAEKSIWTLFVLVVPSNWRISRVARPSRRLRIYFSEDYLLLPLSSTHQSHLVFHTFATWPLAWMIAKEFCSASRIRVRRALELNKSERVKIVCSMRTWRAKFFARPTLSQPSVKSVVFALLGVWTVQGPWPCSLRGRDVEFCLVAIRRTTHSLTCVAGLLIACFSRTYQDKYTPFLNRGLNYKWITASLLTWLSL